MARKISNETWDNWEKLPEKIDEEAVKEKRAEKFITQIRKYKLITPLFGGGAETKKADAVKIIRETEIRGQLRFWWRAIRGGQFSSTEKMKEVEDSIFGSSSGENGNSSKIQVVVKTWSKKGIDMPFQVVQGKNKLTPKPRKESIVPPYSAFPLQPKNDEKLWEGMDTDFVTTGVSFSVEFTFPKDTKDEIENTLFAWENFGGIGARTRRGFGSICRIDDNEKPFYALNYFQSQAKTLIQKNDGTLSINNEFPLLENSDYKEIGSRAMYMWKQKIDNADEAKFRSNEWNKKKTFKSKFSGFSESEMIWHYLISKLKEFRQYRKNKETGVLDEFGKSQWSEPEALRYRMEYRNFAPSVDKFPRAEFGLPILFHMPQRYDNFDATLLGKGKDDDAKNIERLSSPLILRPVVCSNATVGIALVLNTPRIPPYGLTLTGVRQENDVSYQLTKEESEMLTEKGLTILNDETDVLKAFLETI